MGLLLERPYCCRSHSTDRGQLQHAWREGRLRVAAKATPAMVSSISHGVVFLLCAPLFRRSSEVSRSNIACWLMAGVEARGMLPLGAGRRDRKVGTSPCPASALGVGSCPELITSRHLNIFTRHTPHSHIILRFIFGHAGECPKLESMSNVAPTQ